MKLKGSKYLKVTGFLEILVGIASLAMIFWILKENPTEYNVFGSNVKDTLWVLVLIYAMAGFKILAGILGMIFSNNEKASLFLEIVGMILILIGISSIGQYDFTIRNVIVNIVVLILPAYYLYGAMLNNKSLKEEK